MDTVNIHIKVSGDEMNVDRAVVNGLCGKFFDECEAFEANPFEVGVAIGLMQEYMLGECGFLPITQQVMEHVQHIETLEEE